jgi:hypothetical protein
MQTTGSKWARRFLLVLLAVFGPAGGQAQEQLTLVVPGSPSTLVIPKAGFELQLTRISPDGKNGYFMATDKQSGLNVSFFVEPAEKCKSGRECRDMLQKIGFAHLGKAENIRASEIGDISVIECIIPEFKGIPVNQGNLFAEFVVQGYWVDAHLSKVMYKQADRELFEKLVKSITFVPKENGATTEKTVVIFENRQLAIALPRNWTFSESRDTRTGVQTIAIADAKGEIELQVSFLPDPEGRLASREALEGEMQKAFTPYLEDAVEKGMKFVVFDGPDGVGGYTTFTDRRFVGQKVPDGERLLSTTGMRSWPGVHLIFTLLSNSADTGTYREALELVRTGIRQTSKAQIQQRR